MPLYTISLTDLLQSSIPELSPSFPAFHFISNHIFRQLTSGLSYLHGRGIAHRDIGPSNVLFDHHGSPIWIDFGTAWSSETSREAKGELEFELGTMPYRAPELLFGSRHYSPMAIDQWSLGVLLAEFFCPLIEDDDHTPIAHAQFPPPQFQEREAMFSFDGNDDGGVGEGSVLDWYSTPADQIWTRPSSDTWIDRSDDAKGSNEKCSLRRRKTLFVGHMGDIGLVGSIFKILGTPDLATWPVSHRFLVHILCPKKNTDKSSLGASDTDHTIVFLGFNQEAKDLPDFSKLCFHTYSRQDLKEVLPYIELIQEPTQRDQLVDLISNLLVYSSHLRLKVDQVLLHPWLQQSLKDVYDGKTYKDWMKVWI